MFRCEKVFRFEASYQLPQHDGKCARLHGHSWVGRIVCEGEELHEYGPKQGMLVDYVDMVDPLHYLVGRYLDHWHLNDTLAPFGITNPTSEEIARWIFTQLKEEPVLPAMQMLVEVQIEETCTSRAIYRPSKPTE